MHANNEVGTLANLQEIGTLCRRFGAYFGTDTVQTLGYYPINLKELPIDFLAGSAHKFHGPKGVGFIYINQQNSLRPFLDGGSQERNMRGGTENIAGILGMAAALLKAYGEMNGQEGPKSGRSGIILRSGWRRLSRTSNGMATPLARATINC